MTVSPGYGTKGDLMDPHVRWLKDGTARLSTFDGADNVAFLSTISSPPGSRLDGELVSTKTSLRLKIHDCKLQADGTYELRGRLLDVTRGLRTELSRIGGSV